MDLGSLRHIGRLGKPWGHRGELVLHVDESRAAVVMDLGVLFAEIDGSRVPFHISSLREHPRVGAVVKFEGLDDPQACAFLVNRDVFEPPGQTVPELEDEEEEDDDLDPSDLVGLHVVDEEYGDLGMVIATEGTEDNPLMVVQDSSGAEILIPLVNELITGIDMETGKLVVQTPPGLVDLYRGA